jgi:oligopeptide/dipeptide ABC transporter ATP-binding protein
MKEPTLLLADEPTTALDVTIQAQIMDLMNEVNESHNTAIVLISHNLALVSQHCHRVIVMYAGRIVEELDVKQLITDPKHPYTRALIKALPEVGHARDKPLAPIPGETPEISAPPSGCPYHPRCPLAIERCRTERPRLVSWPDQSRRVACHVANDIA